MPGGVPLPRGRDPGPLGKDERAVRFVEKLRHTEGPLAGQPFRLHPWQARIVRKVGTVQSLGGIMTEAI
jgi:hypothetical protein